MNCVICKGDIEDKLTAFMAEIGEQIIVVKKVPSQVCRQCGEVSYNHETAIQLERIVNAMKDANNAAEIATEIAVVNYSAKVVA
ncbi:hypothetical protein FACS1894219_05860 [Clostridia bacterium]|nr:hypothetical protein FACS1894219_05860 [Clostridia bacterium]